MQRRAASRAPDAAEAARDALAEDRYAGFAGLTRELDRGARETGTLAFHLPRYGEAIAEARRISG